MKNQNRSKRRIYANLLVVLFLAVLTIGGLVLRDKSESRNVGFNVGSGRQSGIVDAPNNNEENQNLNNTASTATNNSSVKLNSQSNQIVPPTPPPAPAPAPPMCNRELKESYDDAYTANVNSENINYESNLQSIGGYYAARGIYDSSYRINAQAQETSRHNAALASLNAQYKSQLSSINCL